MIYDINRLSGRARNVCPFGIVLFLSVSLMGCSGSDYTSELSGGYLFVRESSVNQYIVKRGFRSGDPFIPCTVISYVFDRDFILAAQKPSADCFKHQENEILLWIINHSTDEIIGPLGVSDYLEMRGGLNIPFNLQLELTL